MRNYITDHLLLLLLAVIWSSSFLLIKIGVESIPPFSLTAGRLCIAAIILWIYLGVHKEGIPLNPQALLLYLVAGVLGNSLPFVLISWGEISISSSLAALLMGIMPIGTFVLAHLFIPTELMTGRKLLGITIGFTGLTVLVGFASLIELGQNIWGQLSVLGGALCYATFTVFVRTQPSFEIHKMATGMCTVAAFLSLILAFTIEDPTTLVLNTNSLLAMFALGLFPTALASIIYFRVVRNLGATKFAQINYLIPILGGLWGIILLGETLEWHIFAALLLVLSGVYLVQVEKTSGAR